MARDTSPSSSEDEAESPAPEPVTESRNKVTRFDCPADFVSFCHVPCSSTLAKSLKSSKKELWLIKAPASFEPECLRGVRVPLSGLQTLPVPGGGQQQAYSVLASGRAPPDLHLLTADRPPLDGVLAAPAFSGQLNLFESPAGAGGGGAPIGPGPPRPLDTRRAQAALPALRQRDPPGGQEVSGRGRGGGRGAKEEEEEEEREAGKGGAGGGGEAGARSGGAPPPGGGCSGREEEEEEEEEGQGAGGGRGGGRGDQREGGGGLCEI
ncbi:DNA-directed RNA polymerase I subunit RPA34 [Menidia menidia]